jgi:hypothetical protein
MYLHCNAEFIDYASTSFGHTNTFGCVQNIFLSSYSDMIHLNYRTVIPALIVVIRGDRTPWVYSTKYRRWFLRKVCKI